MYTYCTKSGGSNLTIQERVVSTEVSPSTTYTGSSQTNFHRTYIFLILTSSPHNSDLKDNVELFTFKLTDPTKTFEGWFYIDLS